jgi:hypothetical protein
MRRQLIGDKIDKFSLLGISEMQKSYARLDHIVK